MTNREDRGGGKGGQGGEAKDEGQVERRKEGKKAGLGGSSCSLVSSDWRRERGERW